MKTLRSNSHGGSVIDANVEFNAFDALPPSVRSALNTSPMKVSASSLAESGWTEDEMLWSLNEYAKQFYHAPPTDLALAHSDKTSRAT